MIEEKNRLEMRKRRHNIDRQQEGKVFRWCVSRCLSEKILTDD